MSGQDGVGAFFVDVFCVDESSVKIEDASSNGGETTVLC
jgi:hypothetical protein